MFTIKYGFLSFLWSLLPIRGLYTDKIANIGTNIKKNTIAIVPSYIQGKALDIQKSSIFPWRNPKRISFIELQEAADLKKFQKASSSFDNIIQYQANDSITFDIQAKDLDIYGAGIIGYANMQLTAENISLNWANNTIKATGKLDEQGKMVIKPVLQQDKDKYIAETIRYNFKSKRGVASKFFTKKEDILIRGQRVKMDTEDTYYADDIKFTSCNLTNPHYFIRARNLKFVKDKRTTSGPFQFYFNGVPTALGFFYGVFFMPTPKASGIIRPQIGEDGARGFFLREGGYYFYFNDYIDLAIKGTIYSRGDSDLQGDINYKKRYGYNGNINYKREITSHTTEIALQEDKEKEWRLQWNHSTKNNRISSLTAKVDIQSRSPRHSLQKRDQLDNLNAKTQSKIRYTRKLLGTPYTFNSSLSHSKDFKTKITNIIFPQVVFTTSSMYPLRFGKTVSNNWYENVSIRHTFEFQNDLTNVVDKDTLEFSRNNFSTFLKNAKYGAKHYIPVETNIKIFKYFNLKPSLQYTERWYLKRLDYKYIANQDNIIADTTEGFYRVWDYSTGAGLQTVIYGTHFFKEQAKIQAIRHRVEPSIGLMYNPDFTKEKFGYWQKILTPKGEEVLDKFSNGVYGTPKKHSALLTVKLNNVLETKVRNNKGTYEKSKKIPILESLSIDTSYDFLKDSFPLGDINLGARTKLLDSLINLEYTTVLDPYVYKNNKRVEQFTWHNGQGLGNLKKYTFKTGTTLKSEKKKKADKLKKKLSNKKSKKILKDKKEETNILVDSNKLLDPNEYVDFDVPWQLGLDYHQTYTCDLEKDKKETIRQFIFKGNLNVTANWKVVFNSTYDIDKKELVGSATKLGIYRDLHCWEMKFDWVPLAKTISYEFSIGLKASMLKDLKYPHNREYGKV